MNVDVRSETGYVRAAKAVTREKYEVVMLTNEVIEAKFEVLQARQDELRRDLRELRADNRCIQERIHALHMMLIKGVDAVVWPKA